MTPPPLDLSYKAFNLPSHPDHKYILDFLNLASCSEHFISIKHRILATFNINKKNQF
jgi:hypothetical protein